MCFNTHGLRKHTSISIIRQKPIRMKSAAQNYCFGFSFLKNACQINIFRFLYFSIA